MNRRMIARILGILMLLEAGMLVLPLLVSLYYSENVYMFFLKAIGMTAAFGALMFFISRPENKTIYARDGFAVVTLGWVFLSLFGALPFFLSGSIPNYLDAVFETVSGFTTTGASILTDVEVLPKSMLFWRSFTHWIGGMGVLVFIMAVLPLSGGGGDIHLMRAESPGPDVGKLVPKSNKTARILYGIYLGMTATQILMLVAGGVPLFDSVTLTFGTAGTGGFGIKNTSIAGYSNYAQTVITVFMALFGVNFNLYFLLICRKFKDFFKSEELRAYLVIMFMAIGAISFNIKGRFDTIGEAVHHAAFQVSSVMTTTGFSTVDFDKWPELSRMIMLMVMCIGACAGSTGGGFKVSRILILLKSAKKEIKRIMHPRNVTVIMFDGKRVSNEIVQSTQVYLIIYMLVFVVSLVVVSLDRNTDLVTNVSGVIATLNNIGPGLGKVGASGSFAVCSSLSKFVYICDMLMGRLELYPFFFMLTPKLFKRRYK